MSCLGATHVRERMDEHGKPYRCTADDTAYATFELANGVVAQFNSSWTVRVRRDDLLTLQVDGTKGSAVAGLRDCVVQHGSATPRCTWNPDIDSPIKYLEGWNRVPDWQPLDNAFKVQWELFLRHVVLRRAVSRGRCCEGAKGVQLAELGLESWAKRAWVECAGAAGVARRSAHGEQLFHCATMWCRKRDGGEVRDWKPLLSRPHRQRGK